MTATRPDEPRRDEPGRRWAAEFSAIYDSNQPRLVRWLTAIFGARDAEDIAQEALLRLYTRPGMLDEDADAWPWLAVVARNVGRDLVRHNAFSTTVGSDLLDQLPDDARVHDQVVARDDAERLAAALRRISARDRMLLHLRDVDGVPVADIAAELGMNDNALRQLLFRARRRLANAFVELGGDRRPGIVTLLGVRLRELFRRAGRAGDALGPVPAGVLAAVGPAAAALLAGSIFGAGPARLPGQEVHAAGAPEPYDTAARPARAAGSPATGAYAAVPAGARPGRGERAGAPAAPYVAVGHEVGPADVSAWHKNPFTAGEGEQGGYSVTVEVLGERHTVSAGHQRMGEQDRRAQRVLSEPPTAPAGTR